ncbi:MAG: hypothetical protein JEZ06_19305 [Anaerolineaceae bacterium]|nr:hypothetical protein [Anaerolineaceae bacterium]
MFELNKDYMNTSLSFDRQSRYLIQIKKEFQVLLKIACSQKLVSIQQNGKTYELTFPDSKLTIQVYKEKISFEWKGQKIENQIPMDDMWFGMGQLIHQRWPLNDLMMTSTEYITMDNGLTGLSTQLSPIWLNHRGVGLIVHSPIDFGMNQPPESYNKQHEGLKSNYLPFGERPWLDSKNEGDGHLSLKGEDLCFDILLGEDYKSGYHLIIDACGFPEKHPPLEWMDKPIWTTWARYKDLIDQETVLTFAKEIQSYKYPYQIMEIDDRWQVYYGDLEFDPKRFPDPKAMIDSLHEMGFKVTVWVIPFLDLQSDAGKEAAQKEFLVKKPDGSPYAVNWWQGKGYLLDATNPDAMQWFAAKLNHFRGKYGLDGFKFDAGEAIYVPKDAVLHQSINSANQYTHEYIENLSRYFSYCEVRSGWMNQKTPLFFRIWDLTSNWDYGNGLKSLIPSVLALSVTGYPYILPDMIGGNAYFEFPSNKILNWIITKVIVPILEGKARKTNKYEGDEVTLGIGDVPCWIEKLPFFGYPTEELIIRWTQLNTFLQAMQFSLAPWDFGEDCINICRRYAELHEYFAPTFRRLAEKALEDKEPVIRPLSWLAPDDERAHRIDDQFLVGDEIMVAPVVDKGARKRDIYIPPGEWQDYWSKENVKGPQVIKGYAAPLAKLPLFVNYQYLSSKW